ncbi:MAG: NAD(P)/FAD-dependent oxidoreductase [Candidatus Howiella sp.]|jgi:NAD(P)H-nitrite reductase large subunit
MRYVIIGNSAAAVGGVEGIRTVDPDGSITLISSETHHTYSRPLISYLLYGKTDLERMKYRPDDFYTENRVKALLGKTATVLDTKKRSVTLDDGGTVTYDRLLIATGSRPFTPPIAGLDEVENKFTFMSLDDAAALEKALSRRTRVLIMGAGLIGLKCAEGIAHLCGHITVADLADRILPSILDGEGAALVQKKIEQQGNIDFILGDSVASFEKNQATLASGRTVPFDLLVVAVGVRPNTGLFSAAGGETGRGIKTDLHCATSLKNVWAAGDCAESHDVVSDTDRVLALLPNAYMQGRTAGINMAGGESLYDQAIAMNAMGMFGYHIITAGCYEGEEIVSSDGEAYKKLFVKDDRLAGYILIGDVRRAGIYTKLVRERTPLSTIDFALIKDKPQLMAFAKKERRRQLATRR